MQALALPLEKLLGQVKDNANAIVLSVLVFSYHVFENEFPCSCTPQRAWSYTTSKGSCHFGCTLLRRTVKAVCVGLLWATSVLIDAEWYVCCCNYNPRQVAALQCQIKTNDLFGDKGVVTIAEMKSNSRMYGIALLFAITFIGALLLSTWTILADVCLLPCCMRRILVHELILEVGEDVVSEAMKEGQKRVLSKIVNDYISQGEWEKCLDVVEDLIEPIEPKSHNLTSTNSQKARVTSIDTLTLESEELQTQLQYADDDEQVEEEDL
ncbi:uncharacterized protein LOC115046815 [Echeneis naucrates]|uniref:uncharacterized protein LOC115046815 n=1 Tax=Echeneis naucrates TaxID=173247 RepID=UPI00111432BB|nr:uncharacterized protein LOC115046815 [Echeneis naucrates]